MKVPREFMPFASALAVATFAFSAGAADSTAAQALFNQARKAMAEHQYAEACPKLEESLRLEYGLGTLLNLADCEEHAGKLATAWTRFLELASKAHAAGQLERARIGRERAAALEPKLSNLLIDVPPESRIDGLQIQRDGTLIGPAEWGTPIPADAGTHTIVVSAPGRQAWTAKVNVTDGATMSRVTVPPLLAESPMPSPVTTAPVPPPAGETLLVQTPAPGESSPAPHGPGLSKTLAIVSGVVGLAGVGVGTYFGLKSISDHRNVSNQSTSAGCTPMGSTTACSGAGAANVVHLAGEAKTAGNISTAAFIVGGVGLAGAVVLWVTAPRSEPGPALRAQLGIGPGSLLVSGAW